MLLLRILAATALLPLLLPLGRADIRNCLCDLAKPETLEARECSLCRTAETQPNDQPFFFVKDVNPNKPNRLLSLPRLHAGGPQDLATMTAAQRTAYWTATIARAREIWGDGWGLAVNSVERRTQCHMHIHIGKLLDTAENFPFTVVAGPADIPLPLAADGLLVHPSGDKLHIHTGNDAPELQLQR
jgi:CDP-diacylglycerol pyrophosphatase